MPYLVLFKRHMKCSGKFLNRKHSSKRTCNSRYSLRKMRANINSEIPWELIFAHGMAQETFSVLLFIHSVMRIAHLTTMLCTWAFPAARKTTMAVPISPQASSSSAAPKSLSSFPHNSLLPNSPRMVGNAACKVVPSTVLSC